MHGLVGALSRSGGFHAAVCEQMAIGQATGGPHRIEATLVGTPQV
jgi:hypothetical protein